MARIRPTNTQLINKLSSLRKAYFTLADLEKVLNLPRETLYVTANRLVKEGVLLRLAKNVYVPFTQMVDEEKIADELYFPSYLSFEKALSNYGILSQIPFTLTFATTRPPKQIILRDTELEYTHIKESLFFGYILTNGKNIAEPEKALLDELYLMSRGKRGINLEELDLRDISKAKFFAYAGRFPSYIGSLVAKIKKYIGTTPIGLGTEERVHWSGR